MRRKLVIYTSFFTAGIAAGYFVAEKNSIAGGIGFLIGMGIIAAAEIPAGERIRCGIFLMSGFILLAFTYAFYESFDCTGEGEAAGRVVNVSDRGDFIRIVFKDRKSGRRLLLDIESGDFDDNEWINYAGAEISCRGTFHEFDSADNPGCFDYRLYMRSMGVCCKIKTSNISIRTGGDDCLWRARRALYRVREDFLDIFDERSSSFLKGVIFGDKSEIDEDVLREFSYNSSGHILAVSGLHIGFLYTLLRIMMRNKKTWPASVLIIAVLALYGEMTMWSSSTVRAVIVLSANLLSVNLRRRFDLLTSLSASALVILVFRPYMLFNTGFQLSYAAMGGIAYVGGRAGGIFGKAVGSALSVQVGTLPLIALAYKRINLWGFIINIPIIMLSSFLVPVCIITLVIYTAAGFAPDFAVDAIEFLCECLIDLNHYLSAGGMLSDLVPGISAPVVIMIYLILIMVSCEWTRINLIRKDYSSIVRLAALSLIPIIMMNIALFDSFRDDEIVFLSVGQGDCTHVRSGPDDVFIDGGGSDFQNTGERVLMPYLLSQGCSGLDMAIVTHLHKDHYLGIAELSEIYPVLSAAIPEDYREYYERQLVTEKTSDSAKNENDSDVKGFMCGNIIFLNRDSCIRLSDEVAIEVLWPDAVNSRPVSADDANEHNMVYMIHYRGVKIMITGDLLEDDELKMVRKYKGTDRLKCDILKVAHHGSKSSSSEAFLDAASPEIAVIQAGRNNIYGHPHQQTLERLEARGISTYRTDTDGAVGVDITRNGEIRVHTMH